MTRNTIVANENCHTLCKEFGAWLYWGSKPHTSIEVELRFTNILSGIRFYTWQFKAIATQVEVFIQNAAS